MEKGNHNVVVEDDRTIERFGHVKSNLSFDYSRRGEIDQYYWRDRVRENEAELTFNCGLAAGSITAISMRSIETCTKQTTVVRNTKRINNPITTPWTLFSSLMELRRAGSGDGGNDVWPPVVSNAI